MNLMDIKKEEENKRFIPLFNALQNADEETALAIYKDLSKDNKSLYIASCGNHYPLINALIELRWAEQDKEIKNCLLNTIKNVVNDSNINDVTHMDSIPGSYVYNFTPIMRAIRENDVEVMKILLQNKNIDLYRDASIPDGKFKTTFVTAFSLAVDNAMFRGLESLTLLLQHKSFNLSTTTNRERFISDAEYLNRNLDRIKNFIKDRIECKKPSEIPPVQNPGNWDRKPPQEPKKPLIKGKKYKVSLEDYHCERKQYYKDLGEFQEANYNYNVYLENLKEYEKQLEEYNKYAHTQNRLLKIIEEKSKMITMDKPCSNNEIEDSLTK